jgi:hypothetical protein
MVFPHVGHFIKEKVKRSKAKVKRERLETRGWRLVKNRCLSTASNL